MVKKVKAMVSEIEQRMIKPASPKSPAKQEKKERKQRTKKNLSGGEIASVNEVPKVVEAKVVETKSKRQLSPLQLQYNKYKTEQYVAYKAKGILFRDMLKDEKFKAGWRAAKAKL